MFDPEEVDPEMILRGFGHDPNDPDVQRGLEEAAEIIEEYQIDTDPSGFSRALIEGVGGADNMRFVVQKAFDIRDPFHTKLMLPLAGSIAHQVMGLVSIFEPDTWDALAVEDRACRMEWEDNGRKEFHDMGSQILEFIGRWSRELTELDEKLDRLVRSNGLDEDEL